ncbi:hypothetical protein G6F22_021369 [Rhizopus arrhizus]|nr:hypothetical protein G6F22_021369 [Rhizopus arrhizus]
MQRSPACLRLRWRGADRGPCHAGQARFPPARTAASATAASGTRQTPARPSWVRVHRWRSGALSSMASPKRRRRHRRRRRVQHCVAQATSSSLGGGWSPTVHSRSSA